MNITATQLRRAADIQEKIESLSAELESILGGGGNGVPSPARMGRPKKIVPPQPEVGKGRRKMSPAARARIAAAAKARWAAAKKAGKNSL